MRKELHGAHFGIVKTKFLARALIWWPSLNPEIEKMCKECTACQKLQSNPAKAPLQGWPIPEGVLSRIHVDFFEPRKNLFFLIIVDAYSKWLEVFPMSSITSTQTILKLRELFARSNGRVK